MADTTTRTYPHGVPCWVDAEREDLDAAQRFYGALLGWSFEDATGGHGGYFIATLDGQDVAAIGPATADSAPDWSTYVAVDDADVTAAAVREAGGEVLVAPVDAGPGGRLAVCADPEGAEFRLWQARARPGAQRVNVPGTWNFSDLKTADPERAPAFYAAVFGWETGAAGPGEPAVLRRPGYGDHLAATSDPEIHARQDAIGAPEGFADVIGWVGELRDGAPRWGTTFAVADRDAAARQVQRLGGEVLDSHDTPWTKVAIVRDPAGAELMLSQFTPPGS